MRPTGQWNGTFHAHVKNVLISDVQRRKEGYVIEGTINIKDNTIGVIINTNLFNGETLCEKEIGEGKSAKTNKRLEFFPALTKGTYLSIENIGAALRLLGVDANGKLAFELVGSAFDVRVNEVKA